MKDIINSLSLGSGALVVAILSALIAAGSSQIKSKKIKGMSGFIIPFFIAYCLYRSPAYFFGSDPSEYSAWSGIVIMPWNAAGTPAFFLIIFVMYRIKRQ